MDVTAIVCTRNSEQSLQACLRSLVNSNVREIIVVDAHSTDATQAIAERYGATILSDAGEGLGAARNIGIAASSVKFILNMGSDNFLPVGQLEIMMKALDDVQGVGAVTVIASTGFIANGLNAWRRARFRPGEVSVIGTPSLFNGDLLRANPFDEGRRFSDDSELCERWRRDLGARFVISSAVVMESGRTSISELVARCKMYGVSDGEVFRDGVNSGWSRSRRVQSLLHPLRVDLLEPMMILPFFESLKAAPFLVVFVMLRYLGWIGSR